MIAKWFLIIIVYSSGWEADSARVFVGESEADCREAQEIVTKRAAESKVDAWTDCVKVKREPPPKPIGDPKTESKS